ncbi:MAG: hypothetical protein IKU26_03255 [Clostridia bacterium]|nr:hypothetical protein [Clostridia bacterium]
MGNSNILSSYRKKNVDAYIIDLNKQHDEALKAKDAEIEALNKQYIELQGKYAALASDVIELQKDKARVANALLEAETTAAAMIEQARGDAEREKTELLAQLEQLREEVIDRNRFIQNMKKETAAACNALKDKLTEAAALAEGSFDELSSRYAAPAEEASEAMDE